MLDLFEKASAWDKPDSQLEDEEREYLFDPVKYDLHNNGCVDIEKLGRVQHKAKWVDVERKAKRIVSSGGVVPIHKRPYDTHDPTNVIESKARVQGDHGSYQVLIHQPHPRSRAIRWWDCQCAWRRYVWDRSPIYIVDRAGIRREINKKFEGRICSHVLAAWWVVSGINVSYEDVPPEILARDLKTLVDQGHLFGQDGEILSDLSKEKFDKADQDAVGPSSLEKKEKALKDELAKLEDELANLENNEVDKNKREARREEIETRKEEIGKELKSLEDERRKRTPSPGGITPDEVRGEIRKIEEKIKDLEGGDINEIKDLEDKLESQRARLEGLGESVGNPNQAVQMTLDDPALREFINEEIFDGVQKWGDEDYDDIIEEIKDELKKLNEDRSSKEKKIEKVQNEKGKGETKEEKEEEKKEKTRLTNELNNKIRKLNGDIKKRNDRLRIFLTLKKMIRPESEISELMKNLVELEEEKRKQTVPRYDDPDPDDPSAPRRRRNLTPDPRDDPDQTDRPVDKQIKKIKRLITDMLMAMLIDVNPFQEENTKTPLPAFEDQSGSKTMDVRKELEWLKNNGSKNEYKERVKEIKAEEEANALRKENGDPQVPGRVVIKMTEERERREAELGYSPKAPDVVTTEMRPALSPDGTPLLDENGNPVMKEYTRTVISAAHTGVTVLSFDISINDITIYIQSELSQNKKPKAYVRRDVWGEQRGGLHPHPDAIPTSMKSDGSFVYGPDDLGYHPEIGEMGHSMEERSTYGMIPIGGEVDIQAVDPKERLLLVRHELETNEPNHSYIKLWIPIKDVDLI